MRASEARELIKEKPLSELLKFIKECAERGEYRYFIFPTWHVSDERKLELIKLGYKVYTSKDHSGMEGLVIEW